MAQTTIKSYLGPKGYSITKDSLSISEQHKIRNELTVKPFTPPNSMQKSKPFTIYRESPKKLYVPRMYGIEKFGNPNETRISEGENVNLDFKGDLRDYQKKIINAYICESNKSGCGLLEIPCGRGKCLGYNTPILMADNSVRPVQTIQNGDKVMGDDFTSRTVNGVNKGNSQLYRITQSAGMPYVVNDEHILTLYNTFTKQIEDIALKDLIYIEKYDACIRNRYYGIRILPSNDYILSMIIITPVHHDTRYYGFMIGGNHRFMLGDNTLTHNTVMALNIISQLKKKTLVVVHKEFLMNQWIERIQQFLPDARIGKLQGTKVDIENKDIVIGMLQSLSMKDYPSNTFDSFGLTISDECFPAGTKVYTQQGYVNIEDLKKYIGKVKILSYNHKRNRYEFKYITNWFERKPKKCIQLTFQNDESLFIDIICSEDHRIYNLSNNNYIYAKNMILGNKVLSIHSKNYTLIDKTKLSRKETLYDIEVEQNHNFFVKNSYYTDDSILVHNCHHISAEVFCRSLFKVVTKYMLGLSATMKRKDGLTKVFKYFIGNVAYKEKREGDDSVLVKLINYYNTDKDFSQTIYNFKGQVHYAIMIRKLCEFNHRTEFVLKVLKDILDEKTNSQVMILAHNKSVLKYLHDAIEHRNIASVGYYVGGMKESALKETETKEVVIATYAMAEEALDIKTLSCLIMATPKTDVTQAVGRILRVKHKQPLVIDIVDQHDIFQRQSIKRMRFYKKCKYKVIETDTDKYKKNEWNTLYEPKKVNTKVKNNIEAKEQKKIEDLLDIKIKKKEQGQLLQGTCLI